MFHDACSHGASVFSRAPRRHIRWATWREVRSDQPKRRSAPTKPTLYVQHATYSLTALGPDHHLRRSNASRNLRACAGPSQMPSRQIHMPLGPRHSQQCGRPATIKGPAHSVTEHACTFGCCDHWHALRSVGSRRRKECNVLYVCTMPPSCGTRSVLAKAGSASDGID